MSQGIEEFEEALGGDVVIPKVASERPLDISTALALRGWFDARRRLSSRGGRPTDPDWTLKRSVPFDESTWSGLKALAEYLSDKSRKVSPAQVAAMILREVMEMGGVDHRNSHAPTIGSGMRIDEVEVDQRYREWRLPDLFAEAA